MESVRHPLSSINHLYAVKMPSAWTDDRDTRAIGTFPMEVSMDFFDLADRMWPPPDAIEYRKRDIRIV